MAVLLESILFPMDCAVFYRSTHSTNAGPRFLAWPSVSVCAGGEFIEHRAHWAATCATCVRYFFSTFDGEDFVTRIFWPIHCASASARREPMTKVVDGVDGVDPGRHCLHRANERSQASQTRKNTKQSRPDELGDLPVLIFSFFSYSAWMTRAPVEPETKA